MPKLFKSKISRTSLAEVLTFQCDEASITNLLQHLTYYIPFSTEKPPLTLHITGIVLRKLNYFLTGVQNATTLTQADLSVISSRKGAVSALLCVEGSRR
jgi:hypothetical protein